jgi:integrase
MDQSVDPRRPVRALTPKEFAALLRASPPNRQLAYWLAGGMGIRWSEIRKVRWTQVNLAGGWIRLPASMTKNRKEAFVPIPPTVLKALKTVPARERMNEVCPHPPRLPTFVKDAKAARLTLKTEAGSIHRRSLRKTFITHLALAGVDLRTAQRLARHSRPELTSNIYTDPHLLNMEDAMDKISKIQGGSSGNYVAGSRRKPRKSA